MNERQLREQEAEEQVGRQAAGLGYELILGTHRSYALGIPLDEEETLIRGRWIDVTNRYDPDSHGGEVDMPVYGTLQQVVAWLDAEQQISRSLKKGS